MTTNSVNETILSSGTATTTSGYQFSYNPLQHMTSLQSTASPTSASENNVVNEYEVVFHRRHDDFQGNEQQQQQTITISATYFTPSRDLIVFYDHNNRAIFSVQTYNVFYVRKIGN